MSNSPLVSYTKISPNKTPNRNGTKITKITPHHMSGNLSIETCGQVFAPSARQASSNYGIGSDGRIGMYVEEKDRAWTSSNRANDMQAVTIEVANSQLGGDWPVSNKAWNSLVNLCVDICKRNGIPKLVWTGDSSGNLTVHKMFANTDCPGPYLYRRMPDLAKQVNAILAGTQSAPYTPAPIPSAPSTPSTSGGGKEQIKRVQEWCNSYGYKQAVDGYNGPNTRRGLCYVYQKELNKQFNRGLKVDGLWGPATKAASVTVKKGAKGNLTKVLQGALIVLGYDTGGFDGIYGGATEAAVRAYQKVRGLAYDGIAGPETFGDLLK